MSKKNRAAWQGKTSTVSAPLERVLDQLGDRGLRCCGSGYEARCPSHDDRRHSLTIGVGDEGRVLLKCQKGCDTKAVVAALGLTMADLFSNSKRDGRRKEATYDYHDKHGRLRFQVVRCSPKAFFQRRPDGNGGWVWDLKDVQRVLYRLPELLAADPNESVYLCEGEKDVGTLAALGLVATTAPGGAGKWRQDFSGHLRGRHVVIVPDNDDDGWMDAEQKARSLYGTAESVKVLDLPGLPRGGDVSDWLGALGTAGKIRRLAKKTPEWHPGPCTTETDATQSQMSHSGAQSQMSHSGAHERTYVGKENYLSSFKGFFSLVVINRAEAAIQDSAPIASQPRWRQVFPLVRKLKAIPQLAEAPICNLKPLLRRWYDLAGPKVHGRVDDYWDAFLSAWQQARSAEGDDLMGLRYKRAVKAAQKGDLPRAALEYTCPKRRLLVCLCRELQRWWQDRPFPLAGSVVGSRFGVDRRTGNRWLTALVADGILRLVDQGSYKSLQASTYRYLPDDAADASLQEVREEWAPAVHANGQGARADWRGQVAALSTSERERWEELSAIREYEGGVPREVAEYAAFLDATGALEPETGPASPHASRMP